MQKYYDNSRGIQLSNRDIINRLWAPYEAFVYRDRKSLNQRIAITVTSQGQV